LQRVLTTVFAATLIMASTSTSAAETAGRFVIRDVRLFDGSDTTEHRSVLVENGSITAIGGARMRAPGATVVSGAGRTLVPGLIDAHVHLSHHSPEKSLQQAARLGVTTVLDMFTDLATLGTIKAIEAADPPGLADVRSAGIGASAPNGHPSLMDPAHIIPTLSSPIEAEAFVDARIAEGSDFIKVVAEDGSTHAADGKPNIPALSAETIRAVIAAAHRRGKLAVVHVQTEYWARVAINAGTDGLAHLFLAESVSPDFGIFAAAHHIFVIPTLTVEYLQCGRSNGARLASDRRLMPQTFPEFTSALSVPGGATEGCKGTDIAVRQLHTAGVPILAGTDAPVPGSTYGASTLDEIGLLVGDGLRPSEALASGTSITAKAFRLNDRGEIKVGKRADLLLVQGDPTRRIGDLKNVVRVWKAGRPVRRVEGAPGSGTANSSQ
jgi:imidazolonepropionase-like amidohydrolase